MTETMETQKRGDVTAAVFRQFLARPGQTITAQELADATGFTPKQVRNAMLNMRRRSEALEQEIQPIIRGNAWRYVPNQRRSEGAPSLLAAPAPNTKQPVVPTITGTYLVPTPAAPPAKPATGVRPSATGELYEEIHVDAAGHRLLRAADGSLWVAHRLGKLA